MWLFSRHNIKCVHLLTFANYRSTTPKVKLRLVGISLVLQVYGHKFKYLKNKQFDLLVPLNEKSGDHQSY